MYKINEPVQSGLTLQDNVSYSYMLLVAFGVRITEWMSWKIRIKNCPVTLGLNYSQAQKRIYGCGLVMRLYCFAPKLCQICRRYCSITGKLLYALKIWLLRKSYIAVVFSSSFSSLLGVETSLTSMQAYWTCSDSQQNPAAAINFWKPLCLDMSQTSPLHVA